MSGASFNKIWDPVVIYGWNCAQGGGRINSSFGALCEQWEGDYNLSGAGTDTLEHHIYFVNLSNGYTRPMSSNFNYDTGVDNFWTYSLNNGMSWRCLTSACPLGNTSAAYFGFSPTAFEAYAPATFGSTITENNNSASVAGITLLSESGVSGGTGDSGAAITIHAGGVSQTNGGSTSYNGLLISGTDNYECNGTTCYLFGTNAMNHVGLYNVAGPLSVGSAFLNSGGLIVATNPNSGATIANQGGLWVTSNGGGGDLYVIADQQGSGYTAITNLILGGWSAVEADLYGDATKAFALTSSGVTMNTLGSSSTDLCITAGDVIATCSSLRKYKDNIQPLDPAASLDEVMKLKPRSFVWKSTGHKEIGFVVDEVQPLDDRLVTYGKDAPVGEVRDPKDPSKVVTPAQNQNVIANGVAYRQMTALLTAAIQAQQAEIDSLKAEVAALKAK